MYTAYHFMVFQQLHRLMVLNMPAELKMSEKKNMLIMSPPSWASNYWMLQPSIPIKEMEHQLINYHRIIKLDNLIIGFTWTLQTLIYVLEHGYPFTSLKCSALVSPTMTNQNDDVEVPAMIRVNANHQEINEKQHSHKYSWDYWWEVPAMIRVDANYQAINEKQHFHKFCNYFACNNLPILTPMISVVDLSLESSTQWK